MKSRSVGAFPIIKLCEGSESVGARKRSRKPTPYAGYSPRVQAAAQQVFVSAMACGLSVDEAAQLVAIDFAVAEVIRSNPGREAEIRREADRATEDAVRAVNARERRAA